MRELKTLITTPFVTATGVVHRPGYHVDTCTFADFPPEAMDGFDLNPTLVDLVEAMRQIWRPFTGYRFASDADRGALLAAVLGIFARPGMELMPGVLVDAPCPASGKTILGQALGALALGVRGPVTPFSGAGDEELKKQVIANALNGCNWLLLDNVVGIFDSAVLAAVLTSGSLRDRVLGASIMFEGEVRNHIILTSNNASLSRDLTSRFIRIRVDSGVERPQGLAFEFCPIERALDERMAIARSVCTLVSGFFAAKPARLGKGDARFPAWSKLVRECVLWSQATGLSIDAGIGVLGDPAWQITEVAGVGDPESQALGQLLNGLHESFPSEWFGARDVLDLMGKYGDSSKDVREGVEALHPVRRQIDSRGVATVLKYRVDRLCDGLVLRTRMGAKKTMSYRVETA
jgi:hypothetical protein